MIDVIFKVTKVYQTNSPNFVSLPQKPQENHIEKESPL